MVPATRARLPGLRLIAAIALLGLAAAAPARACGPCSGKRDIRELWKTLVEGNYLLELPRDPGYGPGSHTHFMLTPQSANGILCVAHGPIQWSAEVAPARRMELAAPPRHPRYRWRRFFDKLEKRPLLARAGLVLLVLAAAAILFQVLAPERWLAPRARHRLAVTLTFALVLAAWGLHRMLPDDDEMRRDCFSIQKTVVGAVEMCGI